MNESRYLITTNKIRSFTHLISTKAHPLSLILVYLLISACSNRPLNSPSPEVDYNKSNRFNYLNQLNDWQVTGKIAFITSTEKESATLFWRNQASSNTEELNLTTFLGIKVLSVSKEDEIYTVEIEDNSYQHQDVDYVLSALTGYQLPSQALKHWLKGIPFKESDKVKLNAQTQLPSQISSSYNKKHWLIDYQQFTQIKGVDLPSKIKITQQHLTIKISINRWTL